MFTVTSIISAQYLNAANTHMDCVIVDENLGQMPVTCYSLTHLPEAEREQHLIDLFDHVVANHGSITAFDTAANDQAELDLALSSKLNEIDSSSKENIETEFQSSALGSVHSYDCRASHDQINIQLTLVEAQQTAGSVGYMAKPSGSFYSEIQHTETQLKQVASDMNLHIRGNRSIARSKKNAAVTAHSAGNLAGINAVDPGDWTA